jgi:ATP-binding cassette subfamily F protein 3
VAYGAEPVVSEVELDLYRGDKVGLIGRNGSGKSTLLKALIGELVPVAGSVKLGNKVEVAYFDQDLSDLNENETVLDNLWSLDPAAEAGPLRSFLARFGFTGEDVLKMVSALSGGEKTKLSLARLLYRPANLIILDEPTNHLDMQAREALESALSEYDGSCLIVSHDRYFLDQVVNRIAHIRGGRVSVYGGNYSEFAEKMAAAQPTARVKTDEEKQDYFTFKEKSRQRSRHKKKLEATRAAIADAESELAGLEAKLEKTERTDDWTHLQSLLDNKKALEERILGLYDELEKLEAVELD